MIGDEILVCTSDMRLRGGTLHPGRVVAFTPTDTEVEFPQRKSGFFGLWGKPLRLWIDNTNVFGKVTR